MMALSDKNKQNNADLNVPVPKTTVLKLGVIDE